MKYLLSIFAFLVLCSCNTEPTSDSTKEKVPNDTLTTTNQNRIPVIFDTDANNELDDQHAIAYLLFNDETFDIKAITTNATFNGGELQGHYDEAERIVKLCQANGKVPLLKGANANFETIKNQLDKSDYDGQEAIDFIIKSAMESGDQKLVLLAVGKLTNAALALQKEPAIADKIRLVWLGSNYPDKGEYNLINDISAMNFLLDSKVPFEMAVCRYGKPSGTDAVKVTQAVIDSIMPGLGPQISSPITGRHGGSFDNFGDYSVNLFKYIDYYGDPPSRALFDMAAVAIVKNQDWADAIVMPAPTMQISDSSWVERPKEIRTITLWENFDKKEILADFFESIKSAK